MKIQLLSDLHFECYPDRGELFIKELADTPEVEEIDVLILAGDIIATTNYNTLQKVIQGFCSIYKNVIYVPGNHEYWRNSVYTMENRFTRLQKEQSNLTILDNSTVTIDNQRFIGGTMWFSNEQGNDYYSKFMPDFGLIDKFVPWVYKKNHGFRNLLDKELRTDDIVVTHHIPSYAGVAPEFKNDDLNRFFLCPMDAIIKEKQPKLWLFGHTHVSFDWKEGNTRLICNPRGYPNTREGKNFKQFMVIDI